jgi:type IV pilus assembly protein PilZ
METDNSEGANKPKTLTLTIKDKAVLYAVYMPFLEEGGLFIPTNKEFLLGEEVSMIISLLDQAEKIAISGVVVWITPLGAQGNRSAGIGVHFKGENIKDVREKIEYYLAGTLKLDKPTYTM